MCFRKMVTVWPGGQEKAGSYLSYSSMPLGRMPQRKIIEKGREFQKNFCFIDYAKAFDCVDYNKLWEILKEMGRPG